MYIYMNYNDAQLRRLENRELINMCVGLEDELRKVLEERDKMIGRDLNDEEFNRYNDLIEIECQLDEYISRIEYILYGGK